MKRSERPWMRLLARLTRAGSMPSSALGCDAARSAANTWAGPVEAIRGFVEAIHSAEEWNGLCRRIAAIFGSSGVSLVRWDALADAGHPMGAFGSWEGEELERLLAEGRCEWAFALHDSPVFALRSDGRIRAARGERDRRVSASAVAVPLRIGADRTGALVCTYPCSRVFSKEDLAGVQLISLCVSLLCSQQDLAATSDRQAKRIARLMDDIERMAIRLRSAPSRDDTSAS
ncbi:MAG: hypothetical protein PHV11_05320 [Candidatus Bipolaricaulis sp.]|nr:hypothetical protein [Candidatus Bipolaricaulis sp.]